MNKKIIFIFLLIALTLTACSAPPAGYLQVESEGGPAQVNLASLADVEFTIVPEVNYYLLLEEDLDNGRMVFSRHYVQYDGFENMISEKKQEIELRRTFQREVDAKEWLRRMAPEELALYPNTYLNHRVLAEWEQDEYDYSIEEDDMIYLENLKRLGAVTRINEDLEIRHDGNRLIEVIEAVESEFLPNHANIRLERELEILSSSFLYQISLVLHPNPRARPSAAVTEVTVELLYNVDELGNPLELKLNAAFESNPAKIGYTLKPVVNNMAVFTLALRDTLVEELGLYGVSSHNPSLAYANITLHYEQSEEKNRYGEKFFVR